MIVRVFKYAFAQAWTRTLRGRLLGSEDWRFLMNMHLPTDFLRYLGGTAYASILDRGTGPAPLPMTFSLDLYRHLFGQVARMLRILANHSTTLVTTWLLRYDAENLKTILRGLWQGRSSDEIRPLLYPLGALSGLPVAAMLKTREIDTVLAALRPTVFHAPAQRALPQFRAQRRLFPLEIAIDQTAFGQLLIAVKALGGLDRRKARDLVGAWVDATNLAWLVRLRHFYGISPEESINYLLTGGTHLTIRDLGRLARAPDLGIFKQSMPPPLDTILNPSTRWEQIQILAEQWFSGKLHAAFMGDPFHIAVPISYLLLKEIEIHTLESLYSSLFMGEPSAPRIATDDRPVGGGDSV